MGQVLSEFQRTVLDLWPKTELSRMFYLAGGTALAQYYFQHRKSEDLDFFTEEELSLPELERFISFVDRKTPPVRPRLRDFVDLYFILQEKPDWKLEELLKRAFEKFGIQVDALQLGENLFQVKKQEDMPVMLKKFDRKAMEKFFLTEARKLEKGIWK